MIIRLATPALAAMTFPNGETPPFKSRAQRNCLAAMARLLKDAMEQERLPSFDEQFPSDRFK